MCTDFILLLIVIGLGKHYLHSKILSHFCWPIMSRRLHEDILLWPKKLLFVPESGFPVQEVLMNNKLGGKNCFWKFSNFGCGGLEKFQEVNKSPLSITYLGVPIQITRACRMCNLIAIKNITHYLLPSQLSHLMYAAQVLQLVRILPSGCATMPYFYSCCLQRCLFAAHQVKSVDCLKVTVTNSKS